MGFRTAGYLDAEAMIQIDELAQTDRLHRNFIHHAVTSRNCHVAVLDRQVVGYGILDYSFFGQGFIATLLIDRDHRRQGWGTGLLRHFEQACKTKKLFTKVDKSNAAFRALLEKLDYRPSGQIENLTEEVGLLYFIRPRPPDDD